MLPKLIAAEFSTENQYPVECGMPYAGEEAWRNAVGGITHLLWYIVNSSLILKYAESGVLGNIKSIMASRSTEDVLPLCSVETSPVVLCPALE